MELIARKGWLNGETRQCEILAGETLGQFADRYYEPEIRNYLYVQVNSERALQWQSYLPQPGDHVLIYLMPQGGDSNGKRVLGLVAAIALTAVAQPAGAAIGSALFGSSATATAIGTGVFLVGASLVMNALSQSMIKPPAQPDHFDYDSNPFYGFNSTRNTADPFGPVPRIYGKMRFFPRTLSLRPLVTTSDNSQYFHQVYDFGYGPLELTNFKLGDTDINLYNDVDIIVHRKFISGSRLKYFSQSVEPISVGAEPTQNQWSVATTSRNTTRATMDVYFPQGLFNVDKMTGERSPEDVSFDIEISKAGENNWKPWEFYAYGYHFITAGIHAFIVEYYAALDADPWITKTNEGMVTVLTGNDSFWQSEPRTYYPNDNNEDIVYYQGFRPSATTISLGQFGSQPSFNIGDTVYVSCLPGPFDDKFPSEFPVIVSEINYIQPYNGEPPYYVAGGTLLSPLVSEDVVYAANTWLHFDPIVVPSLGVDIRAFSVPKYVSWPGYQQIVVRPYPSSAGTAKKFRYRGFNKYDPFVHSLYFEFLIPGQYDIRIKRNTGDSSQYVYRDMAWQTLTSFRSIVGGTFRPVVDHTIVELKIRATEQLSGSVDNFNAVATSILPVPDFDVNDNVTGFTEQPTRNPAWIFLDVLRGSATKYPVDESNIDYIELKSWADDCDTPAPNDPSAPQFRCDLVINGSTTVKETLQNIAAVGRAAPSRRDSKVSVVRRKLDAIPVQLITPKNSFNLQATITYIDAPDALRVSFSDEALDYAPNEEIVYNDGFNADSAVVYESLDLPGTTTRKQAWRLGRYYMASGLLERERVTASMDIENLVAQRGDIVKVATDVMEVGGLPRRITAINGNIITFDESIDGAPTQLRARHGEYNCLLYCNQIAVNQVEVTGGTAAADINELTVGDLVEYGVSVTIYAPYVIESIMPGQDFTADLRLVEFRPEVDESIAGQIPRRKVRQGASQSSQIGPVQNLKLTINYYTIDGYQYADVVLDWEPPATGQVGYYNVMRLTSLTPVLLKTTDGTGFVHERISLSELDGAIPISYAVEPVITLIGKGPIAIVNDQLVVDKIPPPDVNGFGCNALATQLYLFWNRDRTLSRDDIDHFEVRYSATEGALWEQSTIVLDSVSGNSNTAVAPLRSGQYMIKAVDKAGNYSVNAALTIVQVRDDEAVDFYDLIEFHPFDKGTLEAAYVDSGVLKLDGTETVGWFYAQPYELVSQYVSVYTKSLHFDAPTKTRLIASVDTVAVPIDDGLDSFWFSPLSTADPLTAADLTKNNLVDGQIYFRYTDGTFSIESSPWTKLLVADVTATDIQFAVRLETFDQSLTPAVSAASIKADYAERTEFAQAYINIAQSETINFSYGFGNPPTVSITLENAAIGDTYHVSGVTSKSFTITLYDKDGNLKAGQFDWFAVGYGKTF